MSFVNGPIGYIEALAGGKRKRKQGANLEGGGAYEWFWYWYMSCHLLMLFYVHDLSFLLQVTSLPTFLSFPHC
jgi:hypothetical protein